MIDHLREKKTRVKNCTQVGVAIGCTQFKETQKKLVEISNWR
jgi:hypothetical protein